MIVKQFDNSVAKQVEELRGVAQCDAGFPAPERNEGPAVTRMSILRQTEWQLRPSGHPAAVVSAATQRH